MIKYVQTIYSQETVVLHNLNTRDFIHSLRCNNRIMRDVEYSIDNINANGFTLQIHSEYHPLRGYYLTVVG